MGKPAAKMGDRIIGTDTHIVMVPNLFGETPTTLSHVFNGTITTAVSPNVNIQGYPAATIGSVASNLPHLPTPPGTRFQTPPSNRGQVIMGSKTVFINGKSAARAGDTCLTCNDPVPLPVGQVAIALPSAVMVGG